MVTENTIFQWNCQGLRARKEEVVYIIDTFKPLAFAFQETMLSNDSFSLPGYITYNKKGHYNRKPHGGAAISIHHSLPHRQLSIQPNDFQFVAVETTLNRPIILCSLYIPPNNSLNIDKLKSLLQQVQDMNRPVLLLGDFNAHNTAWGSTRCDQRGRVLLKLFDDIGIHLLNQNEPTFMSNMNHSSIDLSLCSGCLVPMISWCTLENLHGSDHFPIKISLTDDTGNSDTATPQYNFERADWRCFQSHMIWQSLPDNIEDSTSLDVFYRCINEALDASVPKRCKGKYFPKPWWSKQLQDAFQKREKSFIQFKKRKSVNNLITWKRNKAYFQYLRKRERTEHWQNTCNSLTINTPLQKVYATIRRIKGRAPYIISPITNNNVTYTSLPDISNQIAQTLQKTTSSANCLPKFTKYRQISEKNSVDFTSNNQENYNKLFTIDDLNKAMSSTKNTAAGPDKITLQVLKHLPLNALQFLLNMFNVFFSKSLFPDQWCHSFIVPILKPGKDSTNAANYRPIALTSVLCKTFERLINYRLLDYFDQHKSIANIQCGGRPKRSTTDHLIRLEHSIKEAFAHNEHFVSIFFDIEKAYDLTWRHGILQDLSDMGLRGRLPQYIAAFLHKRTFQVRIINTLSPTYVQEMGIPQGSVLSVTLFAVKINGIVNNIPKDPRFTASLFVDDFQIGYRHSDLQEINVKLQSTLNKIISWTTNNGFKFSIDKTKAVHFTLKPGLFMNPSLRIYNENIKYVNCHKFLGMTWDRKLTWKPHITKLVDSCRPATNLLKSLTSYKWGAHQHTLLHLYRLLTRSKIDYGSIIYSSASDNVLKPIETLVNDNMRTITGCFKSTPVPSLHVLLGEMPLDKRQMLLSLKYYCKTRSCLANPANSFVVKNQNETLYKNKRIALPFSLRIKNYLELLNISRPRILNDFSYSFLEVKTSSLFITQVRVDVSLSLYKKCETTTGEYRHIFYEHINSKYPDHSIYYTDGSKRSTGVGAAVVCCSGRIIKATLPQEATIFSAELYAISMAINHISQCNMSDSALICTDSLTAVNMFTVLPSPNPAVRKLQHKLHDLCEKNVLITLMWLPSHCGIKNNEIADKAAQEATLQQPQLIPLHYTDYFSVIHERIMKLWNAEWTERNEKMYAIYPSVEKKMVKREIHRKQHVILNRIITGHTRLTHSFLMDGMLPPSPPLCQHCPTELLTIKHLFEECGRLNGRRNEFFGRSGWRQQVLGNGGTIFSFLRSIGLHEEI